jgi:succinoglycan biosynthesis transport protein ExoP
MNEPLDYSAPPDRAKRSSQFHSQLLRLRVRLQRHWWIPVVTMGLALAIQGVRLARQAPSFTSVGQMIVSIKLSIPEGSVYNEEMSNFLGTQVALMQSASVLNRVDLRLQKQQTELPPSEVKLGVSVIPKTTIFVLRATGAEPRFAQAYLQAVMEEYIQLKKEMRSQTSETTLSSITEELGRLERDLRRGEEELVNFQASNSVVFLQEQGNSAGSYLAALNRQLADLRTEVQLLDLLTLEQNLERRAPGTAANDNARALEADTEYLRAKQQIQMLKAEQTQLGEFLRPKHPKMVALSEEIGRREKLLGILRQQTQEQLESRRSSLQLQLENLARQIEEWEDKSLDVSKRMAEYQKIRSNNQRIQGLYDRLLATMQTVGVNKDISPESVTIMQPASLALASVNSMVKHLVVALLLGAALGAGVLLLLDRLDDRMNSFTELEEHFAEPMLGQIPQDRTAGKQGRVALLQPDDQRHAFVEAYRNFRSSLLFLPDQSTPPKLLLVTSSIPNDGKSLTTSNLAITLAHGGARVLLVDADLRKGVLHQRFGVPGLVGLSEALTGQALWAQAVQSTGTPNLSLLPRGAASSDSGELFLQPKVKQFLTEAREQYDYVILDTPPVMAADDVSSLAPLVEGVLFVIRAQHTSARVGRAALEVLYQRGVKVLGLVFNAVTPSGGEYYYYRYHDYYARPPAAEKRPRTD